MRGKRFISSIAARLLIFNLLIVFFPVASVLLLSTYEQQLLQALEHAMVQQGRTLSAALGGSESLDHDLATDLLMRLERKHEARIRILDTGGQILADSSVLTPSPEATASPSRGKMLASVYDIRETHADRDTVEKDASDSFLYRLASFPVRLLRNYLLPPEIPVESGDFYRGADRILGEEVKAALDGRYGAATRISSGGQVSVTLYSAVPVMYESSVTGVVLVSQSTYRILQDLYRLRLDIFKIFLLSLAAAMVISLFLSLTISRPLRRLSEKTREVFTPTGRFIGSFAEGKRGDEIGDLAAALDILAGRLREHIAFIESFAADVSHELKNPISSIRSSAEILSASGMFSCDDSERFIGIIQREAARMEDLVSVIREISGIDTRLLEEERKILNLNDLTSRVIEAYRLRYDEKNITLRTDLSRSPIHICASPGRIQQVLENIIDNALSFSPPAGAVSVSVERDSGLAVIRVCDEGPGIPPDIAEKVFERFYSFREEGRERHAGLGLAIVKAIVTGYGGSVKAENADTGGACITVKLPEND